MNRRSGIESKKRIIDAAMGVFSRHGYAKANIREIAKTAGISVGGVYLYFKNKEELYKSLINDRMRDFGSKIEMIAEQTKSATVALSNFLRLYIENAMKHKEFILLHIREHGFTFGMDEKRQFFRKQRRLIEKIILSGIRTGEFRRCNAKEMAKIIMGSLRGILLSMALDDDIIVTPKGLNEFVLNGLLRKDRKE
ncbi:MAG: TetR/AcrR family transcriptional regulator [Nitrospirota bacterium]